jgi:hypothetical protein
VHHYSWVRTKEELCKKFSSWSHHWERPWLNLVEVEYKDSFKERDFIRGYTYREVEPYFDPLLESLPSISSDDLSAHRSNVQQLPNVVLVDRKQMQHTELMHYVVNT